MDPDPPLSQSNRASTVSGVDLLDGPDAHRVGRGLVGVGGSDLVASLERADRHAVEGHHRFLGEGGHERVVVTGTHRVVEQLLVLAHGLGQIHAAMLMVRVVFVYDGMAAPARNQPPVHRDRDDEGHGQRKRQAAPEEKARQPGLHRARDSQHDRVVHYLHHGDGDGVGGERHLDGLPERHARAQHRPDGQRVAEEERQDDRERVIRFEDLVEKVRISNPDADIELLRRAYVFSAFEHKGQVRHSGEPYLVHPLEVADQLADMKLDVVAIAAGLLHDIVEDTQTPIERIKELFGVDVAHVVEGVTKLGSIQFSSSEQRQAENFRKMLLAMVDDIRVILVKLADRLHNMRTLHHLPEERRIKIAQETRDIYAPIANRLGMSKVKNELEELAFKYLEPKSYESLRHRVESRRRATEGMIEELKKNITAKLVDAQIPVIQIDGRIKRLFSIHQKLKRQKIDLEQVYDLVALRIITGSVRDCYATLGIIHQTWAPVPGRIKDFIAMPRPNGYQSLHTSVVSERGFPFEVQIRSADMHRIAEEGIAAHWKYKEGRVGADRDEQYFIWLRQLLEWQQEVRDPAGVPAEPEDRALPGRGLHLHPEGGGQGAAARRDAGRLRLRHSHRRRPPVRRRPRQRQDGAAPHQAAQRRHRRDRHRAGPQAEPRLAQLRRHLAGPQQDQALHPRRGENPQPRAGKEAVRQGSAPLRPQREVAHRRGALRRAVDRAAACRRRTSSSPRSRTARLSAKAVLGKLVPQEQLKEPQQESALSSVVRRVLGTGDEKIKVRGIDDLMVFRARCCNPIRGEKIVGYITRGKGVSVHAAACPNVVNLLYDPERRIDVEWDKGSDPSPYTVRLSIQVEDRKGILADVSSKIAGINTNIRNVEATTTDQMGRIDMTVEISDVKHLQKVIKSLRSVDGVVDVERASR